MEIDSQTKISVKQKNEIILTSKKLISFCRSGCNLNRSHFNDLDDVISECERVSKFGDISSVRRACKMITENYPNNKIVAELSEEKREELQTKEDIKKFSNPTLQIKRGPIYIEF